MFFLLNYCSLGYLNFEIYLHTYILIIHNSVFKYKCLINNDNDGLNELFYTYVELV